MHGNAENSNIADGSAGQGVDHLNCLSTVATLLPLASHIECTEIDSSFLLGDNTANVFTLERLAEAD